MVKKVICLGAALFFVGMFLAASNGFSQTKEKPITMKIADMSPVSADPSQMFEWWANEIEKGTGGRVKFERYYSGSLIGAYEQLSSVKSGIIHVTPYYSGYHPDLAPLPLIGLMPMVHRGSAKQALLSSDELCKTHPALEAEFKKNNVKYMFQVFNTNHYIFSKKPITSLKDLEGRTIRSFGPYLTFLKELKVNVVSLPMPEIYEAIERGAVDGTTMFLSMGTGARYYEIMKYVNLTEIGHNMGMPAVMNLATWNKLPKDIQDVIQAVNSRAVEKAVALNKESYVKDMKLLEDNKVNFPRFSDEEVIKMAEVAKTKVWIPYVENLEKKGIPGKKVLDDYLKIIEKNAKQQ